MAKKYFRVDCSGTHGSMMTGIQVEIDDGDSFEEAKGKALGFIVQELSRYGLHETLSCLEIRPHSDAVVTVNGVQFRRA